MAAERAGSGVRRKVRWWSMRSAQNLKPATYRCPLCGKHLPALSEHVLIWPEGDKSRRRHAHTDCVFGARKAGKLPSEEEWWRTQPRAPSRWSRLRVRVFGKSCSSSGLHDKTSEGAPVAPLHDDAS